MFQSVADLKVESLGQLVSKCRDETLVAHKVSTVGKELCLAADLQGSAIETAALSRWFYLKFLASVADRFHVEDISLWDS